MPHKWPYLWITLLLPFPSRAKIHKEQWLRGWVPSTRFFLVLLPFCYPGYVPNILLIKAFMNQIRLGPLSVPTLMYTKASERRFTKTKWPFPAPPSLLPVDAFKDSGQPRTLCSFLTKLICDWCWHSIEVKTETHIFAWKTFTYSYIF